MELNEYLSDSHRKRRKRRRYLFLAGFGLALALLIVGCAWLIVGSPLFRVSHITIEGNQSVSSPDVMAIVQAAFAKQSRLKFLGIENMLAWPSSISPQEIALDPQIESITLSKDYLNHTIDIVVAERQPFAIWCMIPQGAANPLPPVVPILVGTSTPIAATSSAQASLGEAPSAAAVGPPGAEACYWFDTDGTLFARSFDAEGDLILTVHDYSQTNLRLGGEMLPDRFAGNMVSILDVLRASGLRVKEIRLNDLSLEEIQVLTYDGPAVYFSLRFSADDDLPVLQSLMAGPGFSKLGYIDFRTEDRAYYE